MSDQGAFCQKCGTPLTAGAAFCSKCGTPIGAAVSPREARRAARRRQMQEKNEKNEKQEKGEKQEKHGGELGGALVGGSILIWVGIAFYLQSTGQLASDIWWAYLVIGIGVILIVSGVGMMVLGKRPYLGQLIGGAILFFVGYAGIEKNFDVFWPLILVVIGVAVIAGGVMMRRKSPTP